MSSIQEFRVEDVNVRFHEWIFLQRLNSAISTKTQTLIISPNNVFQSLNDAQITARARCSAGQWIRQLSNAPYSIPAMSQSQFDFKLFPGSFFLSHYLYLSLSKADPLGPENEGVLGPKTKELNILFRLSMDTRHPLKNEKPLSNWSSKVISLGAIS